MICEMCGKDVPVTKNVIVEGSKLTVCPNCARFGEDYRGSQRDGAPVTQSVIEERLQKRERRMKSKDIYAGSTSIELVDDYGGVIREAREAKGMDLDEFAASILEKKGTLSKIELTLFWPGVAAFALVVVLAAVGKGRLWCNWICPAGTLFTLLSKKSVCAHKVGPGCGNCRACFGAGTSGTPKADGGVTRRDALKGVAVLAAADAVEKTTDGGFAQVSLPGVPKRPTPVLPPGAVDRGLFNLKCVACGLCITSCPGKCLVASTALKRFGQPEMDFRRGYCLSGCNYVCGHVCPAGAIRWIPRLERKNVHVGHAIWKKDLCIRTTDGVQCTACSRKCPVQAIHLVEGFPVVDKAKCIGCGACEHVCPARPMPAIFVKGFERQRLVWPMDELSLIAEMKRLVWGGVSCVAAKDGVIVGQETGRGILPILKLLDAGKLAHAVVVDKVVGRAAAAICVVGGAKRVHAAIMGADAATLLKARGITASADRTVPRILNRDLSDGCPMERAVDGIDDPAEMVKALRSR